VTKQGTVAGTKKLVDGALICVSILKLIEAAIAEVKLRPSALPNSTEGYRAWQLRTDGESEGIFSLQIHRMFKERMVAGHLHGGSVENSCITAGKSVRLQ
jgi:hypothetical protein